MEPLSLQKIADWSGGRLIQGDASRTVNAVSIDSRNLAAGSVYVALRGERHDGHDYIAQAVERGAGALISEKEWPGAPAEVGVIMVADTLVALQKIAAAYRAMLDLISIGLTGSNGKTSTKDMTASVLARRFAVTRTQGNLNNHIGLPLTLLRADATHEVGIFEMGMNHPGEIAPLAAMARPDLAVITGIGTAHIEFMKTREAIAEEKGALIEALTSEGTLILPAQDDYADLLKAKCRGKVVTAGIDEGDVQASEVSFGAAGTRFKLSHDGQVCEAFLAIPGLHMVRNALLATAVGRTLGMSLAECAAGLAETRLSGQRMERREIEGVIFLDDTYNANPDSMVAALETLTHLSHIGRRYAVLGKMGELGVEAEAGYRRVGQVAAEIGISGLIVIGEDASPMAEAARANNLEEVVQVGGHEEAVEVLRTMVSPGDSVLVKGSRAAAMEKVIHAFAAVPAGGTAR